MIVEAFFKILPALQLSDRSVRLAVLPGWGGKVSEIVDLRRQHQWLTENPVSPYRLPTYASNYVRDFDVSGFDVKGFDECFPTVRACPYPAAPWERAPVPDHGEVWSLPWSVQVNGGVLHVPTHGVRLPFRLEKTLRLLGNATARFDYRATNLSPFPMPFVLSSHPLLALRPGMVLSLPITNLCVYSAPSFPALPGQVIPWPRFDDLDLSLVPPADAGLSAKLFSPPLTAGWADLADPVDGTQFRFEFDPAQVTHLGLWLNYGGWARLTGLAPYYKLGLEPWIRRRTIGMSMGCYHPTEHGSGGSKWPSHDRRSYVSSAACFSGVRAALWRTPGAGRTRTWAGQPDRRAHRL